MQFDSSSKYPSRKSPRATFHNYSGGMYFVTICTAEMAHYFGKIDNYQMYLSEISEKARQDLENISSRLPYCDVPAFVIMPNRIHAVIAILEDKLPSCFTLETSARSALAHVIGLYKSGVKRYANENGLTFNWQQRYNDHIIRNQYDLTEIGKYISNNVSAWSSKMDR